MTARKSAAKLQPGDRILRTRPGTVGIGAALLITTVDHTTRLKYGIVRIWHGKHGLQHFDAAGTHLFDLAKKANAEGSS